MTIYISRKNLDKINEVFGKFPDAEFFTLDQDNHSGIGSITTMTVPLEVAGTEGEFTVEINGTEDW